VGANENDEATRPLAASDQAANPQVADGERTPLAGMLPSVMGIVGAGDRGISGAPFAVGH
jgi:hypothetical protein